MENLGDNASRQSEELEALNSIYGEEWKEDFGKGSWGITLSDGSLSLELLVTLTEVYPNQGPPILQILAPSLSRNEMKEITSVLEGIYLDNIGETVIFQWIERAREWLQDKTSSRCNEADPQLSASSVVDENFSDYLKMQSSGYNEKKIKQSGNVEALSYITHGDPIDFKKSTFQGHVSEVTSAEDVKKVLSCLMENKKIANATHNMYAYRIYQEETKTFSQDCDDDGETHAGGRIMHLLQLIDARNVLVVVSRWYGGVHLGPDRFKLINNAARQVIEKAGLLPSPGKKKKH